MTKEEIAKLRALEAAATKGPWRACGADRGGCSCGNVWSVPDDFPVAMTNTDCEAEGISSTDYRKMADAAFIATAREALPKLLDEVERLRRALEQAGAHGDIGYLPEGGSPTLTENSVYFTDEWGLEHAEEAPDLAAYLRENP